MARPQETFNKKELEKKRLQKKKEKEQRKEERKSHSTEGQSWESMLAYVDENGNITSTPPDPAKKRTVNPDDIVTGSRNIESRDTDPTRKGKVTFFNTSKGFGFIKDQQSQESVFVHANNLSQPVKENDKVTFEVEPGDRGPVAVNVKIV